MRVEQKVLASPIRFGSQVVVEIRTIGRQCVSGALIDSPIYSITLKLLKRKLGVHQKKSSLMIGFL